MEGSIGREGRREGEGEKNKTMTGKEEGTKGGSEGGRGELVGGRGIERESGREREGEGEGRKIAGPGPKAGRRLRQAGQPQAGEVQAKARSALHNEGAEKKTGEAGRGKGARPRGLIIWVAVLFLATAKEGVGEAKGLRAHFREKRHVDNGRRGS